MNKVNLFEQIQKKKSFLCVGLDSDINKIPKHLLELEDPVFEFNKQIIDATLPYTISYKPNIAFYESRGAEGWISLQKTIEYLKDKAPEAFTIADAKRGDIGNTSKMYAKAFFENMHFDAITVAPYMGVDSVSPFLEYKSKWVILLALTSNKGASDFQLAKREFAEALGRFGIRSTRTKLLYEKVLIKSQEWSTDEQMMYVIGATKATALTKVRSYVPNHFLLVPGVGAQGGSLQEVAEYGMNSQCGLIVNSSRGIIFASDGTDFAEKAGEKAKELQMEMEVLLRKKGLI
jgi:orotidine-5'-phosphate decarboxylase